MGGGSLKINTGHGGTSLQVPMPQVGSQPLPSGLQEVGDVSNVKEAPDGVNNIEQLDRLN